MWGYEQIIKLLKLPLYQMLKILIFVFYFCVLLSYLTPVATDWVVYDAA
jgi:hypothetical protein